MLSRVQQFYHLCISRPYHISVNFITLFNIFTLPASKQSFDSLFHSFFTLCENEYFLISNLHCSLANAALCHLVILYLNRDTIGCFSLYAVVVLISCIVLTCEATIPHCPEAFMSALNVI